MSEVRQRSLFVFAEDATPEEVLAFLTRIFNSQGGFVAFPFAVSWAGELNLIEDPHDLATFMRAFANTHEIP